LFNNLNLFYAVVTEFCTVENNPTMSAGPGCVSLPLVVGKPCPRATR